MSTSKALDEALAGFEALVAGSDVGAAWEQPSVLDGYTVGGLVAHVAQGVAWLARVAGQEPAPSDVAVVHPGGYFAVMKREPDPPADPDHDAIVAQGNHAARHGWEATLEHVRATGTAARAAVAAADPERAVDLRPVLPFAVTIGTFAATRIVELVVHGDDIAVSVGRDGHQPGRAAFAACAAMLTATAATQHDRLAVVRALSRRERATGDVFPVF